eukprot:116512_1
MSTRTHLIVEVNSIKKKVKIMKHNTKLNELKKEIIRKFKNDVSFDKEFKITTIYFNEECQVEDSDIEDFENGTKLSVKFESNKININNNDEQTEDEVVIKFNIEYKSQTETILSLNMNLTTEEKDWNNNYIILKKEIESKFPSLKGKDYETQDKDECDVSASELLEYFQNGDTQIAVKIACDEEEEQQPPAKIVKQIKINYGKGSILWIPPNPNSDNDKDWEDNYNNFIEIIESKCN